MKFLLVAVLAVVLGVSHTLAGIIPAVSYFRAPQYDSAVVHSERLGGSFSYSTIQNHGYAAVQPIVRTVYQPLAFSYNYFPYQTYYGGGFYNPLVFAPASSPGAVSQVESISSISSAGDSGSSAPIVAPEVERQETSGTTALDDDSVSVESAE